MMPCKKILIFLVMLFFYIYFSDCLATPQFNQQDPYVIHTVKCSDKFYIKRDKLRFDFGLSPFYQQTHYARNGNGAKVPLSEMNGKWNMLAPFFGISDMTPEAFNSTNYPHLKNSYDKLQSPPMDKQYTNISNYDPNSMSNAVSFNSIKCDYEKLGIRGKFGFDLGCGIGLNIKGGLVDCKYTGTLQAEPPDTESYRDSQFYDALLSTPSGTGIFNDFRSLRISL